MEVADVGPSPRAREGFPVREVGLDLDETDQLVARPRTSRRTLADLVKGGRSRLSFPFRGGLDPALKGAGASLHGDQVMMA
jgi:hypothetical protein